MKNKKKFLKWVNIVALAVLIFGGINFLMMGMFGFDMFVLLGGPDAVVSRIFYSLFGIAALVLLATILWNALATGNNKSKSATKTTDAQKTSSTTKTA